MNVSQTHKLTDRQFLKMLKENNGNFALTAKAIERRYGIRFSRQAVRQRSAKFMTELKEMRAWVTDYAEGRLTKCVIDDDFDLKIGCKIAMYLLDNLGKNRGYGKNGVDKVLHPDKVKPPIAFATAS